MEGKLKTFCPLKAPYIKINTTVIPNGQTNGKNNIPGRYIDEYVIAPSAKKIATFIKNQLFGSDLLTQTEGLNIRWLTPTFQEAVEKAIYQEESFIYIHYFNDMIYLEVIDKHCIENLVQEFDIIKKASLTQEFEYDEDIDLLLKRNIVLKDGKSILDFKAFEQSRKNNKIKEITIDRFNKLLDKNYKQHYELPYECIINIDIGQDFFKDSRKILNEEMEIINTIADEIEKTKTRIATSQHFQTNDIVTGWKPATTTYNVQTLTVGKLQDYFTLLPGEKDEKLFEFLQGNIRIKEYVESFKFYDYQVIQMAGLSPASFGYEKDAYMNVDNVNVSKNPSDMTIESLKTQLEPQINKLLINIVIAQKTLSIKKNLLPKEINWDYGPNEKFDDIKKIQVLGKIQSVASIPYEYKAKIIAPILKKIVDEDFYNNNSKYINDIISKNKEEEKDLDIKFGEI